MNLRWLGHVNRMDFVRLNCQAAVVFPVTRWKEKSWKAKAKIQGHREKNPEAEEHFQLLDSWRQRERPGGIQLKLELFMEQSLSLQQTA